LVARGRKIKAFHLECVVVAHLQKSLVAEGNVILSFLEWRGHGTRLEDK